MFGKKGNLIGLLLSAICLYLVFRKVDLPRLGESLASLNYAYLAAALAVFMVTFVVRTARWQALLAPTKAIGYGRLFAVVFIGYMANNVLPARLGEFVRAYVLSKKEGVRKTTTLATIFIERIFDGLSLLFILGLLIIAHKVGLISNNLPHQIITGGLLASVVFIGAFGFVAALEFVPGFGGLLRQAVQRFAPPRIADKLHGVLEAFISGVSCLRSFKRLVFVFLSSLAIWAIEGTTYALMGQAFHLALPITAFLVTMVLVNLASIVPSAPGQVGTFQFFCVATLGMFGVSPEAGLSYGLVLNVGEYLPVTLLGIAFLAAENLSFKAVMAGEGESSEAPVAGEPLPAAPKA